MIRFAPLKHYISLMRLNKPVGILLLWLPCLIGIFSVSPTLSQENIFYSGLFLIGSILMRGAGCVINDYHDREFDKYVARTKNRPIASGAISPKSALIFFVFLCLVAAQILWFLPLKVMMICFFSVFLVALYPLMKRITYWPQAFLGIVFNMGVLVGALTLSQTLDTKTLWLYGLCFLHTIGYDTIYAFQDIQDDMLIGVKSSAQKVQKHPKLFLSCLYSGMIFCLWMALADNIFDKKLLSCILFSTSLCVPLYFWNPNKPEHHSRMFQLAIAQLIIPIAIILK